MCGVLEFEAVWVVLQIRVVLRCRRYHGLMELVLHAGVECCMYTGILLHLGGKQAILQAELLSKCTVGQDVLCGIRVGRSLPTSWSWVGTLRTALAAIG